MPPRQVRNNGLVRAGAQQGAQQRCASDWLASGPGSCREHEVLTGTPSDGQHVPVVALHSMLSATQQVHVTAQCQNKASNLSQTGRKFAQPASRTCIAQIHHAIGSAGRNKHVKCKWTRQRKGKNLDQKRSANDSTIFQSRSTTHPLGQFE